MSWNDLLGRELGQYTILAELGRGGSSHVYRASDPVNNREVAIKVIPNDTEDRVGFVRRFQREVQAVEQLNHPNIVAVFDKGETDDLVYLVMQCVNGGTLRQRLGKPLAVHEATAFAIQMAQALHHAHVRGIIHRDVKPSNMLVDAENSSHLLLTDFGIAKLQGTRGMTKSGTTVGTPEYMAPEQAEGKEIDQRADVYALGCVLYEMLAGRPPFTGATPVSVLYQQVHSRPAYIRGFNPEVPRELSKVLDIALAKRPIDRFGTADAFAEALVQFSNGPDGSVQEIARTLFPARPSFPPPQYTHRSTGLPKIAGILQPEGSDKPAMSPEDRGAQRSANPGERAPTGLNTQTPPPAPRERKVTDPLRSTIPLPAFRLPAKPTRPLDPEQLRAADPLQQRGLPGKPQGPYTGGSPLYQPHQPQAEQPPVPETWNLAKQYAPPDAHFPAQDSKLAEQQTALMRAFKASGATRPEAAEVWRPDFSQEPTRSRTYRRKRRAPLWAGAAVAAVLVLSVAGWIVVSASGLGVTFGGSGAHPQPTLTPALPRATATPEPTATSTPAPTATVNVQKQLDATAAASFRSITVGAYNDSSCAPQNATTHFSAGQTVYVNLCTSGSMPSAPVNVYITQGGQRLYNIATNKYLSPGSAYWYSRYALSAGSYDMVVTITLQGKQATAKVIAFTIG